VARLWKWRGPSVVSGQRESVTSKRRCAHVRSRSMNLVWLAVEYNVNRRSPRAGCGLCGEVCRGNSVCSLKELCEVVAVSRDEMRLRPTRSICLVLCAGSLIYSVRVCGGKVVEKLCSVVEVSRFKSAATRSCNKVRPFLPSRAGVCSEVTFKNPEAENALVQ
jgi:hypothetical protein